MMTDLPPEPPEAFSLAFADLLDAALDEILRDENPERFLAWMRDQAPRRFADAFPAGEDALRAFASEFGRALWNATPLPGHGFRTHPLPRPGRNDPCPCGSGRKYKQCCARLPPFTVMDPDEMWPAVIEKLDDQRLSQALAEHRLPAYALAGVAERYLEEGQPKRAATLMEPLFAAGLERLDERYDPALAALCDAYLELGYDKKRTALLKRVGAEAPRPLAASAWQRLATVHCDRGEFKEAWDAFNEAQRSDPDDPSLAALEVTLLLSEGRQEQAAVRARFWLARARREGMDNPAFMEFLEAASRDPAGAMADLYSDASGTDAARLRAWVQAVGARPVPRYTVAAAQVLEPDDPAALRQLLTERLRQMGVPLAGLDKEVDKLVSEFDRVREKARSESEQGELFQGVPAEEEHQLTAPEAVRTLEQAWHEVFPVDKPFSVAMEPRGDEDAWEYDSAARWLAFLEAHPEAFDSLDILDDLATAVDAEEVAAVPGVGEVLLAPLLERAHAILEASVAGPELPRLPWGFTENRPALRLLVRLIHLRQREGRDDEAARLMERLLALNPNDNHGYRCVLVNRWLRQGDDARALALIEQYPDDASAELCYGRVLALFRLNRQADAHEALTEAKKYLPLIPRYLVAKRVGKPKLDPHGVRVGGEDEAWLYRDDMREVWTATPGVMDWLKRVAGVAG